MILQKPEDLREITARLVNWLGEQGLSAREAIGVMGLALANIIPEACEEPRYAAEQFYKTLLLTMEDD
ncbi:MAG: hypothetical protein J2P48_19695 [Alphaproteobacteria bacterium]|nr:hypothetical protein [Alphaproteobacteria bacterium]